jgi:hypothetical protein
MNAVRLHRHKLLLHIALLASLFGSWPAAGAQTLGALPDQKVRSRQFLNGRRSPANDAAARALDHARQQQQTMLAQPRSSNLTASWTAVGPMQVASQQFGNMTGRVTSIAVDPADATGNTVYVGTTGGGVWKSTNAAGPSASVAFVPLTDTISVFNAAGSGVTPTLSIGSLIIANGAVLAGTGDPNDATDSYYGAGILRSVDGGMTWTLAQQSQDGVAGNHSFFGLSVAGLASSSLNPSLVVAAISQSAEAVLVNAESTSDSEMGLYWSSDAGATWHMATIMDGAQTVQSPNSTGNNGGGNAVTSVVWNAARQSFYASVRAHGYYASADGVTWTRLATQPGAALTTSACPANQGTVGSALCPIFRGVLAVQPVTGDMFALSVDLGNRDQGLYQDICALRGAACGNPAVAFGTKLVSTPLETGGGNTVIAQADYDFTLAAASYGTDTILYAGTIDLYRCSLAAGCALRNTTNAANGCTNPAGVAPAQHAVLATATSGTPLLYLGNDGGLWRSTDGVNEQAQPCSLHDANHFQNLNSGIGSLAEIVSFAQAASNAGTLLASLGALGTAGTSTLTNSWPQLSTGEGGTVAIDQTNPQLWYLSTGAGISIARCAAGSACNAADFTTTSIGAAQVADDVAAIHAPWLLDPALETDLIAGTCRVWRGPATGGALWSSANAISRPFATPATTACSDSAPVVRSLAAGGSTVASSNAQNAGSPALYAGMAGTLDGGSSLGGHLFVLTAGNLARNTTVWTDASLSPVTNDTADAGVFNPGGFDVSSVVSDPHDATGATVYATIMGFGGNGINAPHVYRSIDAGAHWTNISANLPDAPANSIIVDPNDANTLYVALDAGVYVTTQVTSCVSANCWSIYGIALPNSPVVQLSAAAAMPTGDGRTGELRAATYGRGIWQIPLLTATATAVPAMSLNPSTVAFASEPVGTASTSATVTVTNTGSAPLLISSLLTTGDFNEADTCARQTIVQNATCSVQVTFLPGATGTRTGVLTVYGNVAGGQATAALTGVGLPPASIVLTPAALTFTPTSVGATSNPQFITVSNTGGALAALQTPVVAGDFVVSASTCGSSLAANVGCTLSIEFAPTASGSRSGTLTVVDSAGTQVASLTGTGTNPATDALTPATLVFAAQQLNTTSPSQAVTLTNSGDVALTLIAAQISSGDFSVVDSCGTSLIAHATCSIVVTYSPKSVGFESGALSITDEFRTQTVALSGTGIAPLGVSLSPAGGIGFGAVGVGLSSAAQTVTLTNNGGGTLAISSIAANGDFAVASGGNTCGGSLAPAAVCTVAVVFSPTAAGVRTGTVTFSDSAQNAPQTIALNGTGVDFSLTSNGPASITIASEQSATYALLLTSVAGLQGSAAFTCAGVPAHAICTVNPTSASLGGSSNVTVTIATGLTLAQLELPLGWGRGAIWLAAAVPMLFALRRRRRWHIALLTLLLGVMACGTSRTVPLDSTPTATAAVTPSGTYNIVVAGSSTGLVRSVNLTLIVQ